MSPIMRFARQAASMITITAGSALHLPVDLSGCYTAECRLQPLLSPLVLTLLLDGTAQCPGPIHASFVSSAGGRHLHRRGNEQCVCSLVLTANRCGG
jgi:hypothetical protein